MSRLYPLHIANCQARLGRRVPTDHALRGNQYNLEGKRQTIVTGTCVHCGDTYAYVPPVGILMEPHPSPQWQVDQTWRDKAVACQVCRGTRNRRPVGRKRRMLDAAYNWLRENAACTDCGLHPPFGALEFDHLPQYDKVATLSRLYKDGDFDGYVEELGKCEAVCANCHRTRTNQRRE